MANAKNVATDRQKLSFRLKSPGEPPADNQTEIPIRGSVRAAIGEVDTQNAKTAGGVAAVSTGQDTTAPGKAALAPTELPTPQVSPVVSAWGSEDESTFQALLSRRKASGYQRRVKDIGGQIVAAGSCKPNANTVVAVIVGIVAERGDISRSELVDVMVTATFPNAKARPADKGWCQGYVAGAIRNGFLTLVERPLATADGAA